MRHVVYLREGALAETAGILDRESVDRLFLVVDEPAWKASGAAEMLEPLFQTRSVTRFSDFELNPKLHDIERGVEQCRAAGAEMVLALGGGTAIDLGKLIGALSRQDDPPREVTIGKASIQHKGPPLVVVPTTAGTGSEATHFAVAYVDGEKYSVAHPYLYPDYVIIDPALTRSLPPGVTAATGLDAFCQAIESIWAVDATNESIGYAAEAVRLVLDHLVGAVQRPTDEDRHGMCRAAHLAGKAINITRTTAPHALSYTVTSKYGIPHGTAVALTLSPLLAFNAGVTAEDCTDSRGPEEVRGRIALILNLLGADDVAVACEKVKKLIAAVGCPTSLHEAGIVTDEELQHIVSQVNAQRLSNNPRRADSATLFALLRRE